MFFDSSLAGFLDFLAFPAHHSSCLPVRLPVFVPPYVGPSGWVGVWLDGKIDWSELAGLLQDGYRMTAPKKLLALLKE